MFIASDFCHEDDKKALDALKAIPGFKILMKAFMKFFQEGVFRAEAVADSLKLGPNQFSEIYNLLPPICEKLGIDIPELYIKLDRAPNAYTFGDTKPSITITSGLVETFNMREIQAVLAHECGHIACNHCLYTSLAIAISSGFLGLLDEGISGLLVRPLEYGILYWNRCSEYSADRAAALVMNDLEVMTDVMIRLSGGSANILQKINKDEFLKQADLYNSVYKNKLANKTAQLYLEISRDHPFTVIRAVELTKWYGSDLFRKIIEADKLSKTELLSLPDTITCPKCGASNQRTWPFCPECGTPLK